MQALSIGLSTFLARNNTYHFRRLQAGEFLHNLTNQWTLFTSDPLAPPCESGFHELFYNYVVPLVLALLPL